MQTSFVHLRIHSEYSLIDGIVQLNQLIDKSVQYKMPAVAITDQSNLFAVVKFYQSTFAAGIKPIIAADIWLENDIDAKQPYRCTLYCQNQQGYKNLLEILSKSYCENQVAGKAIVKREWLILFSSGLIVLSGARLGDVGQALLAQDEQHLQAYLTFWKTHFPNRYYLELQRTGRAHEEEYIQAALMVAQKFQLPVVATNDVCFVNREDFEAHEARVCIHEGLILSDPRRPKNYSDQQYFRSIEEMQKCFADIPEALANTVEIAKRCNVTLSLGKAFLPHFKVPEGHTTESYLVSASQKGLEERLQVLFDTQSPTFTTQRRAYDTRLQTELEVINKMGFAGYFLIVADFTQWARDNDVPVGPGRGSGPGSLVAFALKITDLDPLAHELLFERFLNPERVSMPDFDIDFCMEGRDRVIDYVMDAHGHESVAQIITYGTMAARAVVRDVGRVLGMSYGHVDKIAKLIPFELGMTLDKALEQEPQLKDRYDAEDDVKTLIDLALKLEGTTRNVGKHAGGVVIAPGKLTEFTPLYCEEGAPEHLVTQFDKDDVEAVGLVKFDFLGLRTLTIIDWAVKEINRFHDPVNIHLIPMHDEKTFDLLKACKTTAVFQLESRGMKDLVKRLQPDSFEEIVALVALFRPGPLQSGMVDDFINRKHGRAKVSYPHPKLEPILRPTYGVILYQEQVMQIAQILAGYTLGSADILRRAMGKKKADEMAQQREIFCKGATERGVNFDVANHIFDLMEKFAGYGFNKSHSASYALIAYQTAWLKAHFPAAFMAAVLSADMDNTDKVVNFIEECHLLKLKMSPPDINISEYAFKVVDDNHIRYGLGAIKGAGKAAIDNIIEARQAGGKFLDLFDFCKRIDGRKVNKRVLEALIKSGSMDELAPNRATLWFSLAQALAHAEQQQRDSEMGQFDLFGNQINSVKTMQYNQVDEWSKQEKLLGEKETLGLYLSGHPIHQYVPELEQFINFRLSNLEVKAKATATVAGMVSNLRTLQTKKGDRMAVVTLDDATAQKDLLCFPDIYAKYREWLVKDKLIIVIGEVGMDDFTNNHRIIAREILTIEEARIRFGKYLKIKLSHQHKDHLNEVANILKPFCGGDCPVTIDYLHADASAQLKLGDEWRVNPTDDLLQTLKGCLSQKEKSNPVDNSTIIEMIY